MEKTREIIATDKAPRAIGPYSQAVRAGGFLFLSGQIALHPATGQLVGEDAAAQAQLVMENMGAVLAAAGLTFAHVVKTTIFLADMADFAAVNEVYGRYFTGSPPARSTVAVLELPRGALVEVEAIAALP
jgi:2-iminobutanoate/2-iminopropanoate deaminase